MICVREKLTSGYTEREARVGTIRKTTNGHHQLALALTHHGVRKEKKNFKKENISKKKRILLHVVV